MASFLLFRAHAATPPIRLAADPSLPAGSSVQYPKAVFKDAFPGKPLFVDPSGSVNLLAGVDASTLEMLRHDARATISLLLSGIEDEKKFETAFLKEIHPVARFDNYARCVPPFSRCSVSRSKMVHGAGEETQGCLPMCAQDHRSVLSES